MSQDGHDEFRLLIGRPKAPRRSEYGGRTRPQSFLQSLTPRRQGRGRVARGNSHHVVSRSFHRRVIVKASIKRMAGTGAAKLKDHLNYLERETAGKDAGRGELYGSLLHEVDADAFAERCKDDRHHFRFIVSPEDGEKMTDLKAYTRELVSRMESDLGTRLDWVAVNHYDTAQPHTHILVRGVRDDGKDLVMPRDYVSHGIRERAQEIASLELGPISELEKRTKLARTVEAQRKTKIDRTIERACEDDKLDLSKPVPNRKLWIKQLAARRLKVLQKMGLAEYQGHGQWRIEPDFTKTLTQMGEQNDIIKTLHKALGEQSLSFRMNEETIFNPASPTTQTQTGIVKGFGRPDDTRDGAFVVIENTKGQPIYAKVKEDDVFASLKTGQVVTFETHQLGPKPSDRNIVTHAARHDGLFSEVHIICNEGYEPEYVKALLRRLEDLRRAGLVDKNKAGAWVIPPDYLERVSEHQAKLAERLPTNLQRGSTLTLTQMERARGATWLDEQLLQGSLDTPHTGQDLMDAAAKRRLALPQMGIELGEKERLTKRGLAQLKALDLKEAANALSQSKGKPYVPSSHYPRIEGTFTGTIERPSGKFAIIEKSREFTLVPWRPVMERRRGRSIMGRASKGGGISWDVTDRNRGLSL